MNNPTPHNIAQSKIALTHEHPCRDHFRELLTFIGVTPWEALEAAQIDPAFAV